jgi:hypothetical protein
MKYPSAPLTPFLAALPQKPRHPFRCQLLPSRIAQGLSAGASIACALLNSLVALFQPLSFVFNGLRPLFAKHPGWGYPERFCRLTRVGCHSPTPLRSLRLFTPSSEGCGIICNGLSRSFVFITLQIPPFLASINMPRLFTKLQIPRRANSFFSHRYKSTGVSPTSSRHSPLVTRHFPVMLS